VGEDAFAAGLAVGSAMTLEQAIEFALGTEGEPEGESRPPRK